MTEQQLSLERQFRIAEYERLILPCLQDKMIRFEIIKFARLANANYLSLSQVVAEEVMKDDGRNLNCCISIAGSKNVTRKTLMAVAVSAFAYWLGSIELIEKLGKEGGTN